MELEIYSAFVKAGVSELDAKAAVDSISKEIDKRYALHSAQLATRGDVDQVLSVISQFEGPIITFRDGHFGKTFKQDSVGIATDAVLH